MPQNTATSSPSPWPGGVAPRLVAADAVREVRTRNPRDAAETWAIVDEVIARYPDCLEGIVRHHVRMMLGTRKRAMVAARAALR